MSRPRTATLFIIPVLAGAMLLSGSCGGSPDRPAPEAENASRSVIVIAVEGLRFDALGCYGGSASTPAIDAFAARSIRFDQAWTQAPDAFPALATLLTGLYPTTHALRSSGDTLRTEAVTAAELLSQAGLKTAAFLQGAEGGSAFGLDQGFEQFTVGAEPGKKALAWIDEHEDEDIFVLIAGWSAGRFDDPDAPTPPEGFAERLQDVLVARRNGESRSLDAKDLEFAQTAYAAHVERIDGAIGALIDRLDTLGRMDDSTVILLGASGLALAEHDDLLEDSLYPAVTHVPLLIHRPGGTAGTIPTVVELLDVMPTILDAAGLPTPDGIQGSGLAAIIEGAGSPPYVAFSESPLNGGTTSVVMNGMQMISAGGSVELYDIATDPMALENLAEQFPERVKVLSEHLDAWSKMVSAASLDPELRTENLDDETLDQLRSLGYIQ